MNYAASGLDRVRDINVYDDKRVKFYSTDITRPLSDGMLQECGDVDYILHAAAETHVDNSISDPMSFVYANVVGTGYMLEFARKCKNLKAFIYFSTDEVFGPAPPGVNYGEWDRYNCTNPYSASKAGAEQLVLSYMNTFGVPGFVSHCMNAFGERQHPEKFIPLVMRKILAGDVVQIHSDSTRTKAGSRFYIHARNIAHAVDFLLNRFEQREMYNIVGEQELTNLELAQMIARIMGKELRYKMVDFHSSRPGHDLRYSLSGEKMKEMGWEVPHTIEQSLRHTVEWTLENDKWLYIGGKK
jgi:dTDP-glucose 4,6-dehydratase